MHAPRAGQTQKVVVPYHGVGLQVDGLPDTAVGAIAQLLEHLVPARMPRGPVRWCPYVAALDAARQQQQLIPSHDKARSIELCFSSNDNMRAQQALGPGMPALCWAQSAGKSSV